MVLLLSHTFLGYAFIVPCIMMLKRHLKYSSLIKDVRYKSLGYGVNLFMWLSLVTGIYISLIGVTGEYSWWVAHLVVSFICVVGMSIYIAFALKYIDRGIHIKIVSKFHKAIVKAMVIFGVASFSLAILSFIASNYYPEFDPLQSVWNLTNSFTDRDSLGPSRVRLPEGKLLKKEALTRSKSCGASGCHEETLEQWNDSAHYRSPSLFVEKVRDLLIEEGKTGKLFDDMGIEHIKKINSLDPGRQVFRFCGSCHAPVALATGNIDPEKPLSNFVEYEGSSCVLCHVIREPYSRHLGGGDYLLAAPRRYLFAFSDNPIGQFINRTLIAVKPEFHKKTFMRPEYKKSNYCATCHERLQFNLWEESPYNNPGHTEHKSCHDCHMPQVPSKRDISAKVKGTIANHRFLAAGINLAKLYNLPNQYEQTVKFMQDKKVLVSVLSPSLVEKGGELPVHVRIANVGVGHDFPAGPEADLAEAWVELVVRTDADKVIYESGILDPDGYLDENKVYIYRIIPMDKNQKPLELDRHRSWRFVSDMFYVIPPKKYHEQVFSVKLPKDIEYQSLKVSAKIRYRRPNQQFADWIFGKGKYVSPVVDMDVDSKVVGVELELVNREYASEEWKTRLKGSEGTHGLKRHDAPPRFLRNKIGILNILLLKQAIRLARQGDAVDAKKILDSLPTIAKKHGLAKNLRQLLKRGNLKRERAAD